MSDLSHRLRESAKATFYDPLKSELNEAASYIEKLEAGEEEWNRICNSYAARIDKLEATLRWICGSRTIEYFDGTVQADETKMLWTYRRIAREALEGTYDERIFKDPT